MTLNEEILNAKVCGIDWRFKRAENTAVIDYDAEVRLVSEAEYNKLVSAGYVGYVMIDYIEPTRIGYYVEKGAY